MLHSSATLTATIIGLLSVIDDVFCFQSDCSPNHPCMPAITSAYDYKGLLKNKCQLIVTAIDCISQEKRCNSDVKFQSQMYQMKTLFSKNSCQIFSLEPNGPVSTCPVWEANPATSHTCAYFSVPHLLTLQGSFETCSQFGTFALIDNNFFVVQVTNGQVSIREGVHAPSVTKITLLIRKLDGCVDSRTYEADSDERELVGTFVDGENKAGIDDVVRVTKESPHYVHINMSYILTEIHIRREGPSLGVTIRVPNELHNFKTYLSRSQELCFNGCFENASLPMTEILAQPQPYIDACTALTSPLKQRDLAAQQCASQGAVDDFFDACVFDLMTGISTQADVTRLVQNDVHRLAAATLPVLGRQKLVDDADAVSAASPIAFRCQPIAKPSSAPVTFSMSSAAVIIIAAVLILLS